MVSRENTVLLTAGGVTLVALVVIGLIEVTLGFPGEWASVLVFLAIVGFGFALPQLYLLRIDEGTSSTARLGVITLMLVLIAAALSNTVSGAELLTLWAIVAIAIGLVVGYEIYAGYTSSAP